MIRIAAIAVALAAGSVAHAGYDGTSIASINQSVSGDLADIRTKLAEARDKMSKEGYDGDEHSAVLGRLLSTEQDLDSTKSRYAHGSAKDKAETARLAAEIKKLRNQALTEAMPIYKRRIAGSTGGYWASDTLNRFMKFTHDKDPRVRAFVVECGCKLDKHGMVDCPSKE